MSRRVAFAIVALSLAVQAAALGGGPGPRERANHVSVVGRVVSVADGDTLTVLDAEKRQHRIRLDGIDAPEARQPFGDRSRQSLRDLAHGRDASADCPKVDKYQRQVCRVTVDGLDVGLEQVRRGMAWHFKRYESEQRPEDRRAYAEAEIEARQQRRGLWRDPTPIAPWEFRQQQREQRQHVAEE